MTERGAMTGSLQALAARFLARRIVTETDCPAVPRSRVGKLGQLPCRSRELGTPVGTTPGTGPYNRPKRQESKRDTGWDKPWDKAGSGTRDSVPLEAFSGGTGGTVCPTPGAARALAMLADDPAPWGAWWMRTLVAPPGATCPCCRGTRWWNEATRPTGWRCGACHPPDHLHPEVVQWR